MGNTTSETVKDLTDSFTLANRSLNNVIRNLDTNDSILEVYIETAPTERKSRKRRHSKTRPTNDPGISIQDSCTLESKNKKPRESEIESNQRATTEAPAQQSSRQSLGSCPICFEDYCGQAVASTTCGHVFCLECLKRALKRQPRCPTCRRLLRGKSKFHPIFL